MPWETIVGRCENTADQARRARIDIAIGAHEPRWDLAHPPDDASGTRLEAVRLVLGPAAQTTAAAPSAHRRDLPFTPAKLDRQVRGVAGVAELAGGVLARQSAASPRGRSRKADTSASGKGAARFVCFGETKQEYVQARAFPVIEGSEELLLDLLRKGTELLQRPFPVRCETDEVPAAVLGIATALDEPLLLELVEQADELAAVVAQRVGDRSLRLGRPLIEHEQDRVVIRM